MEKNFLSRQYLESMSSADLIALADDYGIDIPENLSRRFIIGELLEAAEEIEIERASDESLNYTNEEEENQTTLPAEYNETSLSVVLRGPAWAYVFWNLKKSVIVQTECDENFQGLSLRILFYDKEDDEKYVDTLDVQVSEKDREQYIFISGTHPYFTVDLIYNSVDKEPRILASSRRVEVMVENDRVAQMQPGKKVQMSPLEKLSGMDKLLLENYKRHLQSFEN